MKYLFRYCFVACLVGACAQLERHDKLSGGGVYPIAGTGDYCLGEGQFRATIAAAKSGVVAAMKRLYAHYEVCTDDRAQMLHWMKTAGHVGDKDAQNAVISELRRLRRPDEVDEANALAAEWGLEPEQPKK